MDETKNQELRDLGYTGTFDFDSLIKACGGGHLQFEQTGKGWRAWRVDDIGVEWYNTPREAVTDLLIEILKKKGSSQG